MKMIDDIVWYIPLKKLRNAIREYLQCLIYSKEKYPEDYIRVQTNNECAEYFCEYASNAKQLINREALFEFLFEEYIKNTDYKDKLFLEFGVYKGESINFYSNILKDVTFYGFDSFEGLSENSGHWGKGWFDLKGEMPKVNDNVKLIKGYFDYTLPKFINDNKNKKVAFLHIDCDLYSSTKTIFDNLHDKIDKNTIIEFDEYYFYPGWKNHEYKAFQEFCEKYNVKYEYIATFNVRMAVRIISIDN